MAAGRPSIGSSAPVCRIGRTALPLAQRACTARDGPRPATAGARHQPGRSLNLRSAGQRNWPLTFEATDDHGVATSAELRIIQTSGDGENITSSERVVSLTGSGPPRKRRFTHVFDLARSGLTVGNDVIVQLSVRDNRQPRAQVVRSASVILRWPPDTIGMATDLDGLAQQVLCYFRSQRQIIIDAEALSATAEVFGRRSMALDAIGNTSTHCGCAAASSSRGAAETSAAAHQRCRLQARTTAAHADEHAGANDHEDGAPRGRVEKCSPRYRTCSAGGGVPLDPHPGLVAQAAARDGIPNAAAVYSAALHSLTRPCA
jgi:hypothetical protein